MSAPYLTIRVPRKYMQELQLQNKSKYHAFMEWLITNEELEFGILDEMHSLDFFAKSWGHWEYNKCIKPKSTKTVRNWLKEFEEEMEKFDSGWALRRWQRSARVRNNSVEKQSTPKVHPKYSEKGASNPTKSDFRKTEYTQSTPKVHQDNNIYDDDNADFLIEKDRLFAQITLDDDELRLGASASGASGIPFVGRLDEVAIYRQALSAERMAVRFKSLRREFILKPKDVPVDKVTITIHRKGRPELKDFTLIRDVIPLHSIKTMELEPGLLYARSTNFQSNTTMDLYSSYVFNVMDGMGDSALSIGVNNVLDTQPSVIYNGFLGTSDASAYDFVGRYVYLRLTQSL